MMQWKAKIRYIRRMLPRYQAVRRRTLPSFRSEMALSPLRFEVSLATPRKNSVCWKDFIRTHLDVMAATDFFTAEVLTWKGPITYYVLFFIHLETRRICVSGITRHPDQEWMEQQARAVTLEEWGFLDKHKYLLQDRDAKFCTSFRQLIETDGRKTIVLPARSPNLNAYAERWVRSVKEECLSRFILFGERSLRRALQQYGAHYHEAQPSRKTEPTSISAGQRRRV